MNIANIVVDTFNSIDPSTLNIIKVVVNTVVVAIVWGIIFNR